MDAKKMAVLKSKFKFRSQPSGKVSFTVEAIEDSKCPICQEAIGTTTPEGIVEIWSSLPCGHRFGSHCIKTWLGMSAHPACPVCRREMAHSCGHPVLPTLRPRGRLWKKSPVVANMCRYCTRARWKNPSRGIVGRVAVRGVKMLIPRRAKDNLDRIYWEGWRKNHGREFGQWWAAQEPPTEPAAVPPDQGWMI